MSRLIPSCISSCRRRGYDGGGSGRETVTLLVSKTAAERGSPSVVPDSPNSRSVRSARPYLQERGMERMYVGIDVAKDRLDVHVRPTGEAFAVARDGEGLAALVTRLGALAPRLVVLEATGGFGATGAS